MILEETDKTEYKIEKLSDKEIFNGIWTSPRLVFKYLNETKYDKYLYLLLILAGITNSLNKAVSDNAGDNLSLIAVLAINILLGGLLGWISLYIYSALISWTGKWLDGIGDTDSLLRMLSYSMIPSIVSLLIIIIQIIIFGNSIFQSQNDIYENGIIFTIFNVILEITKMTLGIWSLVILIIGVSEIQKISIGKAIVNTVLPVIVITVPIILIILIIYIFN